MANVTVPEAPALSRVSNVELIQTGTWDASTGRVTFTIGDLYSAVTALDCPAIRRPILKLGHTDPRFDGEPAVGYIENMAVADNGQTLVGDYVGMPGWLGPVIASAYPDRSIEGMYDFRCQLGHTHPFVVTAVALLGVDRPAVGTLESLQDVAALYGVEVAAALEAARYGTPVLVSTMKGGNMPNPAPQAVAASVSSEDVRRAFYSANTSWDTYIEEIQLDPLQLIVMDDATGARTRVPVMVGPGDGEAAVTFGDAVPVVVRYEDQKAAVAAAAGRPGVIRYASKAESRGTPPPVRARELPAEPVEGTTPTPTPEVVMAEAVSNTLREAFLKRLGVTDADADDGILLAALDEALAERTESSPPTTIPAQPQPLPVAAASGKMPAAPVGAVVIDATTLELIQEQARRGDEAFARMAADDRDRTIAAAVKDGKIARSREQHWKQSWQNDPEGAKQALAAMPPGLVPVETFGSAADPEAFEASYSNLFPPSREA